MLHIEEPIISIGGRTKHGNSFMEMILPTLGDNNLPLYAAISFYDGHAINADFSARPHIILTISDSTAETIRKAKGYVDVINDAIDDGTILSYDKGKRAALSVIAQQTRLGNITEAALGENLSLFNEKVKKYSVI